MGFILLLLSCWGVVAHDLPFVQISNPSPVDVFIVGEPRQEYQWVAKPTIRVCEATKMPLYRVQKAVHYWENLGYEFDGIYYDSNLNCMEPRFGEIIITLPEAGFSSKHIAATRVYTSAKTGDIVKVKIFILPTTTYIMISCNLMIMFNHPTSFIYWICANTFRIHNFLRSIIW